MISKIKEMINKNHKKTIAFLVMVLILSSLLTLSSARNIISTKGKFLTDGVDVSISATADEGEVTPGKKVKYEPVISYKGVDSYISFTLDVTDENITLDSFSGLNEDWVRKGDYFYYKNIVHHSEDVPTFTYFRIPKEWDELSPPNFMGSKFRVTALCDAVQAKNFTPDFESDFPWGELEIEDNDYDGNTFIAKENDRNEPISLGFLGTGRYALSSDKMVEDSIQPGDTYKNEIHLSNKGENDTEVFFYVSEQDNVSDENLLDALSLTIKLDDKVYYEGTLRASELTCERSLVYMKPGETHVLSYEIHMPTELKNAYEEKLDNFVWNFTATEHPKMPKTGDETRIIIYVVIFLAALATLLFVAIKGKEDEE